MEILAIVQNMQIVDILRSGALIVAFLSILIGNLNNKNAVSNWLLVDAAAGFFFGMSFLLFPASILGYQVSGSLDAAHLTMARVIGIILVTGAYHSYVLRTNNQRAVRLIAHSLSLLALVIAMGAAQMNSQKGGKTSKQKLNDQHLTFGILGTLLWFLGNFLAFMRSSELGSSTGRSLSLRTPANAVAAFDLFTLFIIAVLYFTFPNIVSKIFWTKNFKIDLIHLHLLRSMGAVIFAGVVHYLLAFTSGSVELRQLMLTVRTVVSGLGILLLVGSQFYYQLFSRDDMLSGIVVHLVLFLVLCYGYIAGQKDKLAQY